MSIYADHLDAGGVPFWKDFFPLPVEYGSRVPQQIQAAIDSYAEAHWFELLRGIEQLERPYAPGLYRMDAQDSDWQDS